VDHALLTGRFDGGAVGFDLRRTHRRADGKLVEADTELQLLLLGDRVVGVWSPLDLMVSAAGVRCWGLRGLAPSDARRVVANVIISRTVPSP
jgi:hypothetical protein